MEKQGSLFHEKVGCWHGLVAGLDGPRATAAPPGRPLSVRPSYKRQCEKRGTVDNLGTLVLVQVFSVHIYDNYMVTVSTRDKGGEREREKERERERERV